MALKRILVVNSMGTYLAAGQNFELEWLASLYEILLDVTLSCLQLAWANCLAALTSSDGILRVQGIHIVQVHIDATLNLKSLMSPSFKVSVGQGHDHCSLPQERSVSCIVKAKCEFSSIDAL